MRCKDAQKMMNTWIDGELSGERAKEIEMHIAGCPACSTEAGNLRCLIGILDDVPSAAPSSGLRKRTMTLFEEEANPQGLTAGWGRCGWGLRTVLAAGVLAGLWIGCVLGLSLTTQSLFSQNDMVLALCLTGGIFVSWV